MHIILHKLFKATQAQIKTNYSTEISTEVKVISEMSLHNRKFFFFIYIYISAS